MASLFSYAPLIIFLILLWIRPEYRFLLFYIVANSLLVVLPTLLALRWEDIPNYAAAVAINDAVLLVLGGAVVALRKWLRTRKTGSDRQLDREMERIRADLAAQEGGPQQ
jgi:hypothetical protein